MNKYQNILMVCVRLIPVTVIVIACIRYFLSSRSLRSSNRGVVVLGQQLADAAANEEKRLAAGPVGPSPMPNQTYSAELGESSLIVVSQLPLDTELQSLTANFRSWNTEQRRKAQEAISMDEQYTLLHFAKRCAVFGDAGKVRSAM